MRYWSGERIKELPEGYVFVFGSNPEGRHGKGAAKQAMRWGAEYGNGRGLQGNAYALVTKNLRSGYREKSTGITYHLQGEKSLTEVEIMWNIAQLYGVVRNHPEKMFIIPYQKDSNNLNGYSGEDMFRMFIKTSEWTSQPCPDNILFHNSFRGC